jgi:nucleotide-binding universal stress UspA family protein
VSGNLPKPPNVLEDQFMDRILVPLDGSEFSETALPAAGALAKRFGARLHLASVVSDLPPVPLAAGDGELITRWFEEEESRAGTYLEGVRSRLSESGVEVETHVKSGPVARTVDALATEKGVGLVVLTTHGRGSWQRAWLGSVADSLIRRSGTPLLLLREQDAAGEWEGGIPRKVIVPLDGSQEAEVALAAVRPVLEPGVTQVDLVMVIHEPFPLATTYLPHAVSEGTLLEARKERAKEYLGRVEASLKGDGIHSTGHVVVASDAGRGVLSHLEDAGADLIAIATRGRGGAARLVLGSVADKVIRGAQAPILVARRPEGEDEE